MSLNGQSSKVALPPGGTLATGGALCAELELGWDRTTVRKGLHELRAGVTCVDAVAKKTAFVQQVVLSLKLPNLRAVHARVENLSETYDLVVSRAFATLADFARLSANTLADGGVWLAMKGKPPAGESAALPPGIRVFHVEQIPVPGLDAQRCLVWMDRLTK